MQRGRQADFPVAADLRLIHQRSIMVQQGIHGNILTINGSGVGQGVKILGQIGSQLIECSVLYHLGNCQQMLPKIMTLPCGFGNITLLRKILTFLHFKKTDTFLVFCAVKQLRCHKIKDTVNHGKQEESQDNIAQIHDIDPVYVHGAVFLRLHEHIKENEDNGYR